MLKSEIIIAIESEKWVKEMNNYMNLNPEFKSYFPDDCFIARGTGRENKHLLETRGITLDYQGLSEPVLCFMELRDSGKFRPSDRGAIREFYKMNNAKAGDCICFIKQAERVYRVTLNRTQG